MDDASLKPSAPSLPAAAIAALQQGNKIEAIKIVREDRNIGLKEAKDAVEAYVLGHPGLKASLDTAQAKGNRTALNWVLALIALALLAFYFLKKP